MKPKLDEPESRSGDSGPRARSPLNATRQRRRTAFGSAAAVVLSLTVLVVSCSKQESSTNAGAVVNEPVKAKAFHGQDFQTADGSGAITLVSPDELEIRTGGLGSPALICKYTRQADALRVVVTVLGTTEARYFKVIPEGLRSNDGMLFFDPVHLSAQTALREWKTQMAIVPALVVTQHDNDEFQRITSEARSAEGSMRLEPGSAAQRLNIASGRLKKLYAEAQAVQAARMAWAQQLSKVDVPLLERLAGDEFLRVKSAASLADALSPKQSIEAAKQLADATATLGTLFVDVRIKDSLAQVDQAFASGDKFLLGRILAELTLLIPGDSRVAELRAKAAALPWPKAISVDIGGCAMEFVLIPSGSFTLGLPRPHGNPDRQTQVTISRPFYIGKYEATHEQWKVVLGENPGFLTGPEYPVNGATWNDCQRFINAVNVKQRGLKLAFPTEAQWEYACRAGSSAVYGFDDDKESLGDYAWYTRNTNSGPKPVGTRKPNAWGVYDMLGNVREWCADWYGDFPGGSVTDPTGPVSGSIKVARGSDWGCYSDGLEIGGRTLGKPADRAAYIGFRAVINLAEP